MDFRVVVALGSLALVAIPANAGADLSSPNLIENGNFARGILKRPWTEVHPGSRAIPGWRVIKNVDYVPAAYWEAPGGVASVDLDGSPGPGEIAQTFATIPGHTYRVDFDLAANTDGPPRVKELRVSVAGTRRIFGFDRVGHSNRAMGYVQRGFEFTAIATATTLDFASLSRVGNWHGAVLGGVAVTETEPGTTGNRP